MLIQNYIYDNPQTLHILKQPVIDRRPTMLEYFSSSFSLYPFCSEKYGHSMAPLGGGMEHQTMTTQGAFDFTLTAHELGHQWFGDNVTCASWADIWLNEGFASYAEYVALQHLRSAAEARTWMDDTHNSVMSQTGGSVFVSDTTDVKPHFQLTSRYDKGAALVHMLRFWFNNDAQFFSALQTYQTSYRGGTAVTSDLQQVLETASGLSLTDFFSQWFYGQGYPTFAPRWNQVGTTLIIKTTETTSRPAVTPFFFTPLEYRISRTGLPDTTVRVVQDQPVKFHNVSIAGTVTNIEADPNQWVLNRTNPVVHDPALTILAAEQAIAAARIYPNPFTDVLRIEQLPDARTTVTFYDVLGNKVRTDVVSGSSTSLNTAQLPAGLYMLRLASGGNEQWHKLVK